MAIISFFFKFSLDKFLSPSLYIFNIFGLESTCYLGNAHLNADFLEWSSLAPPLYISLSNQVQDSNKKINRLFSKEVVSLFQNVKLDRYGFSVKKELT